MVLEAEEAPVLLHLFPHEMLSLWNEPGWCGTGQRAQAQRSALTVQATHPT